MKKIKNISVITGIYKNRDGQEKKRYQNIGSVFVDDNDNLKIKIDSTPIMDGGWNGWANCYDLEEKTNKQEDRHDDIPF
jgi:cytidylate kinase